MSASTLTAVLLAKILGGIGRALISAGVLVLLFAAYQLWGTGLRTDRAQDKLRDAFGAQVSELQKVTGVTLPPGLGGGGDSGAQAASPTGLSLAELAKDPKVQEYARTHKYQWGESIGKIVIPKIGADFWMIEGVELSLLSEGPGHFPTTPLPGQPGNAALAGHRTTWKAPFNRIDELSPGDKITVETLQGRFTYEVMPQDGGLGYFIVNPSNVSILEDKGDNRLTLMACHPKYSAAQRIVVTAKLVENPAEESPQSEPPPGFRPDAAIGALGADEQAATTQVATLAAGDDSARIPAIEFGAGAGALWLLVALLGHWKRRIKWPAYAVGLIPFGVLLWFCFENINRALPAGY